MSETRLATRDRLILTLVSIILLSFTLALFIFRETPVIEKGGIAIPLQLGPWYGRDIPHTAGELGVLGNVALVWREYRDKDSHFLWLIAQQTPSMARLHNVYVSLIASGTHPAISRQKTIATTHGPLHVSTLTLTDDRGKLRAGYLWYQWTDRFGRRHSAPNRWAWYEGVLLCRWQQDIPQWRLVEITTPQDNQADKRLAAFARTLYELP